MRIAYNLKHRHVIRLKFGDTFLTSLTMFPLEAKANVCSAIKEIVFLYYKFLRFVIVAII